MKKIKEVIERKPKQKNPTTNYAKDSHGAFCKRCFEHNGCCINTGSMRKDSACGI